MADYPKSLTHKLYLQVEPEPLEIDLLRTAVIVVDMQNCFINKGGIFDLCGWDISASQRIIEPIIKILNAARAKGLKIVKVAHVYSPDLHDTGGANSPNWYKDISLATLREKPEWRDKFYIRGTWGAEIIEQLKPQKGDIFIEKPRYSTFFGTKLNTLMKTHNVKYLIFVGVTTNCCVEASIRDAYNLDYFCILVSDATTTVAPTFVKDAAIYNIKYMWGWVTTTDKILAAFDPV